MAEEKILVVEDDETMEDFLREALQSRDYEVTTASEAASALDKFKNSNPDLVVADIRMPGESGLDLLEKIRQLDRRVPVILVTAYGDSDKVIRALRSSADDFLRKPFEAADIIKAVRRQLEEREIYSREGQYRLIYESEEMETLVNYARQVAGQPDPVLITGESGVGKEVLARYVHYQGERADAPLVTVNCGAIPPDLLESELFGHTEGAFTGATQERKGLFQTADGGVLLLDEIAEMPLELQAKLLRVLENHRVKPVGSDRTVEVDVRIIAASNQDLEWLKEEDKFREDLFYRLNVYHLEVPPLRERRADIPVLIDYYCEHYGLEFEIPGEMMAAFKEYSWPGNVREIQNLLRRLKALPVGERLTGKELEQAGFSIRSDEPAVSPGEEFPPRPDLPTRLEEIKKDYIRRALARTDGNRTEAADLLGMNRTTLVETIKRLDIEQPRTGSP